MMGVDADVSKTLLLRMQSVRSKRWRPAVVVFGQVHVGRHYYCKNDDCHPASNVQIT
jgi:hypothetical protein